VESLATQTLVVFVIRTAANPLKSRPSRPLLISVLAVVAVATVLRARRWGACCSLFRRPYHCWARLRFLW
jgi:hypothetical protein